MHISFWLLGEESVQIADIYNAPSNPFKVGDVIYLRISDLTIRDLENYQMIKKEMEADNVELKNRFHLKKIKLVKEGKHFDYNATKTPRITIEYHCEIVDK